MDFERYEFLNPNLFHFVERKDMPDWKIAHRENHFHELYFMLGGKTVFHVNGQKYIAQKDDIVYIPGGSVRQAYTVKDNPMHGFAINFHWLNDNHILLPFDIVMKNRMNNDILSYLKEIQYLQFNKTSFCTFKERALFMLLLNQLFHLYYYKTQTNIDPRIKKIVDYIHLHFAETVEIEMLADMANLHAVYLGKLFKDNTGFTIKAYLNRVRVNHAEQLLAGGKSSVSEVAEQCGFRDIFYFSKVFKKTKGYAPSVVTKKKII
ncbi:helix-turn-helix domain-containing protein [Paenibacillus septentrionalis]|uniref:Helix-turn-helix domain-containing protein n=1 Tax=Paenibacillus septentrionalis TaxID=429342 RepID=A0ABW1V5I4_9BACL